MPGQDERSSMYSPPQPVATAASPSNHRRTISPGDSRSRATSNIRLGSPINSQGGINTPPVRQIPTPGQLNDESSQSPVPLAGSSTSKGTLPRAGESALSSALKESFAGRSPPPFATPPLRPLSPDRTNPVPGDRGVLRASFEPSSHDRSGGYSSASGPDPEIVRRHLLGPSKGSSPNPAAQNKEERSASGQAAETTSNDRLQNFQTNAASGNDEDEFSSLKLQGGDVHREIYRWTEQQEVNADQRQQRSKSFHYSRPQLQDGRPDYQTIREPGGFRREYLNRVTGASFPGQGDESGGAHAYRSPKGPPLTSNFMEFLTVFGHFAGESAEDEDGDESEEVQDEDGDYGEESGLLRRGTRRKREPRTGTQGVGFTFLSLLKGFIGTGVLFMPRAFRNGGILFSTLVLLLVSGLSYNSFLLLTTTRAKLGGTFGSMGLIYGRWLRILINTSLVVSQLGFTSAYIVFTSENLQAFILAVSECRTLIPIKLIILMQLAVFLPLSLYRNIGNLGKVALAGDVFILIGIIYLYFFNIKVIVQQHGLGPDIALFNRNDWTLFIGTAIFTFEGIGLLIPIEQAMKQPARFPLVLSATMVIIIFVFTSMGALGYAAYGIRVKTVILSNMPQDNKLVNSVQFIYSLAILLSTPLQIFPAITILEKVSFEKKSGKINTAIKWEKNLLRFFTVIVAAGIAWVGANDLDKFVALVGSFACVPLVFIYPPLLHYRAIAAKPWQRLSDSALIIFGLVLMAYTTVITITRWIQGSGQKEPGYCDR